MRFYQSFQIYALILDHKFQNKKLKIAATKWDKMEEGYSVHKIFPLILISPLNLFPNKVNLL